MRIEYEYHGDLVALEITPSGSDYQIRLPNGEGRRIRARRLPNDLMEVAVIEPEAERQLHAFRAAFAQNMRGVDVALAGEAYVFTIPAPRRRAKAASKIASGALTAPMVGIVAEVLVTQGQVVEKGQSLVVIGAMKVYVTISAPFAGTVSKLHVQKDDLVAHGASVVDVEPPRPNSGEPDLGEQSASPSIQG